MSISPRACIARLPSHRLPDPPPPPAPHITSFVPMFRRGDLVAARNETLTNRKTNVARHGTFASAKSDAVGSAALRGVAWCGVKLMSDFPHRVSNHSSCHYAVCCNRDPCVHSFSSFVFIRGVLRVYPLQCAELIPRGEGLDCIGFVEEDFFVWFIFCCIRGIYR